jgi:hypothetical protein
MSALWPSRSIGRTTETGRFLSDAVGSVRPQADLARQSVDARFQTGWGHSQLAKVVVDNCRTRVAVIEVWSVGIVS